MLKVAIKTFVKVLFALGAVFGALLLLQRWADNRAEYIEIYNNNDEEEELYA